MHAIKLKLQAWAENNGILGELLNGFRIGRRLDDNLFVLTRCIEISRKERRPQYVTFLDITGAYDKVDRSILWNILEGECIGNGCIQLLRAIYRENTVCVEWEGMKSGDKVDINKGLRQGCPLSPLLFMMYVVRMERALEEINIEYNLSYKQAGTIVEQKLPGLFYADDIVLLVSHQPDVWLNVRSQD